MFLMKSMYVLAVLPILESYEKIRKALVTAWCQSTVIADNAVAWLAIRHMILRSSAC